MRPTFPGHRKLLRASRILGEPEPHIIGYMELLWHSCNETGEPWIGDGEDVEMIAKYPGEPGKLVHALLTCGGEGRAGLIEPDPDLDGLRVHDYYDHAPDYVRKRLKREEERRERGKSMRKQRRSSTGQRPDSDRSVTGQGPDSDQTVTDTPAPAPAPAPAPKKTSAKRALVTHYRDEFERVRGTKPVISWGKDTKVLAQLLSDRSLDEAKWIVTSFLEEPPDWYKARDMVSTTNLVSAANQVLARKNSTPLTFDDPVTQRYYEDNPDLATKEYREAHPEMYGDEVF